MDTNTNASSTRRIVSIVLAITGLVGLYYLYQYLFASTTGNSYVLLSKNQSANPTQEIIISSDNLPTIYEGGEFTISTWIYVNDWSYRRGFNKSILSIEGSNFDIIRIYLGSYKPSLSVRLHTKETGADMSTPSTEDLNKYTRDVTFKNSQIESGLLDSSAICDLPEIELQRWICITVAINGKTIDVYYDGKLARSCVLPTYYKVDTRYSAKMLGYGGFGGQISTTSMYDLALNPEQVYKIYMAGPEPITTLKDWFSYFFYFMPDVKLSLPKTN